MFRTASDGVLDSRLSGEQTAKAAEAFSLFDHGHGVISVPLVSAAMRRLGVSLSEDERACILEGACVAPADGVDFQEFLAP